MKKNLIKGIHYVSMMLLLSAIPISITHFKDRNVDESTKNLLVSETVLTDEIKPASIISKTLELIDKQNIIDTLLLGELESGEYSLESPFTLIDPYDISPLTAIVLFTTEQPAQVSIYIKGKESPISDIEFDFSENYTKSHIIPVYGLYPNEDNQVQLICRYSSGECKSNTITIKTENVISDLQNIQLITHLFDETQYNKGFNFSYSSLNSTGIKMAFDVNGNIRWYLSKAFNIPTHYNGGDSLFVTQNIGDPIKEGNIIYEMNALGKIYNVYYSPNNIHHDLQITSDHTMLLTVDDTTYNTIEDCLSEINLENGQIRHILNYQKLLPRTRSYGVYYNNQDWLHMNSAVKQGEDLIVSSNYQSAVIKNDWEGHIKWILSDPNGWYPAWKQYLLTPLGENFEYPYNQHTVEILPDYDNDSDTIDILLFDNGTSRNYVNPQLSLYSRLVHYRIDEVNMTVQQLWEFGSEYPELFSSAKGDADILSNGNFLGCFSQDHSPEDDITNNNTVYLEVNQNKEIIWQCYAASKLENNIYSEYQVERLPFYTEAANDIRLGISAGNHIPQEVINQYAH